MVLLKKVKKAQVSIFAALFTALLGLGIGFYPIFRSGFHAIPGDTGDARFCHFILEYGYLWITGKTGSFSFWNPPIFYPAQNTMAYSDILLGSAPLYWLWRALALSPDLSLQLWMLGLSLLNFSAFYLWMRKGLNGGILGGCAGAFLFAFGSSRLNFLGHSQLLPVFYTPLAALAVCQISQPRMPPLKRRFWEFVFFFSCVGQLYSGFYMGWFLALGIAGTLIFGLVHPVSRKPLIQKTVQVIRADWHWLGLLAALSILSLFPMAVHYLEVAKELGQRGLDHVREPKLQSWIYLGKGSLLYHWQEKIRAFQVIASHEQRVGIGLVTLVLSWIGLYSARKKISGILVGGGFLVLFLSTTSFFSFGTAWGWLFPWIPGAGAVRALSRIGLALLFALATGFAWGIESFGAKRGFRALSFLLLFCLLEQVRTVVAFNPDESNRRVQAISGQLSPGCKSFLVGSKGEVEAPASYPEGFMETETSIDAMWASIMGASQGGQSDRRIVPTLNGYSGNSPKHWQGRELFPIQFSWLDSWLQRHQLDPGENCVVEARRRDF